MSAQGETYNLGLIVHWSKQMDKWTQLSPQRQWRGLVLSCDLRSVPTDFALFWECCRKIEKHTVQKVKKMMRTKKTKMTGTIYWGLSCIDCVLVVTSSQVFLLWRLWTFESRNCMSYLYLFTVVFPALSTLCKTWGLVAFQLNKWIVVWLGTVRL